MLGIFGFWSFSFLVGGFKCSIEYFGCLENSINVVDIFFHIFSRINLSVGAEEIIHSFDDLVEEDFIGEGLKLIQLVWNFFHYFGNFHPFQPKWCIGKAFRISIDFFLFNEFFSYLFSFLLIFLILFLLGLSLLWPDFTFDGLFDDFQAAVSIFFFIRFESFLDEFRQKYFHLLLCPF